MHSISFWPNDILTFFSGALVFGGVLSGCVQVTVPVGKRSVDKPTTLTGSIPSSTYQTNYDIGVDDRAVIAQNLDTIDPQLDKGIDDQAAFLSWKNPISGNTGTLMKIDASGLWRTGCLNFQTTANTITGIRLYTGTVCRDDAGKFAVTSLSVTRS